MPFQYVCGSKYAFPRSNLNRILPCLLHIDAERKTGKKQTKTTQKPSKVQQKSKYKYANGMKNQHQSYCRLVDHICNVDFSLKTCMQTQEYQPDWSRCESHPMLIPHGKEALGVGRWMLVVHSKGMHCSRHVLWLQPTHDCLYLFLV